MIFMLKIDPNLDPKAQIDLLMEISIKQAKAMIRREECLIGLAWGISLDIIFLALYWWIGTSIYNNLSPQCRGYLQSFSHHSNPIPHLIKTCVPNNRQKPI